MNKPIALGTALLFLALGACSSEKESSAPAPVAADDNDAAEPVAAPVATETPHDEDVPHTH